MRILLSAYLPSDWIYPAGIDAEHVKGQRSKEPGPGPRKPRQTPALSGLLRFVRDDLASRVVRARKKIAKVLLYPLLGYPVALFRTVLILEYADRAILALPRVEGDVGHEAWHIADERHEAFVDLADYLIERIGVRVVASYRRKHLVLLSAVSQYSRPSDYPKVSIGWASTH